VPAPLTVPEMLTASEIVRMTHARELSCVEALRASLEEIERRDDELLAWAAVGENQALAAARRLDALPAEVSARLPLLGVPVGIKDVFDTADLPTEYGSELYAGNRPTADAALVVLLRNLGAVVVGKTRTSEFAVTHPAATRNPRDLSRTPGGSSSGSAAAVTAGMVPLATGTQTAGSTIRPASFCGVYGLKTTRGVLPLGGVLPTSSTLDTAGLFARTVADLELALRALIAPGPDRGASRIGAPLLGHTAAAEPSAPRLAFTDWGLDLVEPDARSAIHSHLEAVTSAGAELEPLAVSGVLDALTDAQITIQRVECAAALGPELDRAPDAISPELTNAIELGRATAERTYLDARKLADACRWELDATLARYDGTLAASTLGVAPVGAHSTGDSRLCRPWTLHGAPCLALPGPLTPVEMPAGIQLVGRLHGDLALLATARWIEQRVSLSAPARA
jgi:Asp-tRNA(Asn)/Glu-tRNA(Gln) amidotransferase A subunit family amidase